MIRLIYFTETDMLFLIFLTVFAILFDAVGDYLHKKRIMRSIYIGKFHLEHEYIYFIILAYVIFILVR